jgi:hypothetical protein
VGRPPKATTQITLMVPDDLLRQAELVAAKWSRPGVPVTRLDVLRAAAVQAIPVFLAEAGEPVAPAAPPSKPASPKKPSSKR